MSALWHGYRAGRKAAWLPAANWEHLLEQPLERVREDLRIRPLVVYPTLRESALAA